MSIKVKIKKAFKDFLLDVDFSTEAKQLGILGASGCGKSMTLKCIAGIETPDEGQIIIDGRVLFDSAAKINLPPQARKIGYLFQNYALFPTMTVLQNVASGIREKKAVREALAREVLETMGLSGFERRYPDELSGGQQQRVALARMLAARPQMILLDEPFSALDAYLRDALQREMKTVIDKFEGHVMMVSHSRDELYRLCSHMAVMDAGHVLHLDATSALFEHPIYVQAARLTGCKNISEIERLGAYEIYAKAWGLTLRTDVPVEADIVYVGIRAHHFRTVDEGAYEVNTFLAELEAVDEAPFERHYFMKNTEAPEKEAVWWKIPKLSEHEPLSKNKKVCLCVKPKDLMLLKNPPFYVTKSQNN